MSEHFSRLVAIEMDGDEVSEKAHVADVAQIATEETLREKCACLPCGQKALHGCSRV